MVDINSDLYSQLGINQPTETTNNSGTETLGQEEFLQLMMAQLQAQDPLAPMENGDFIGQMASFGTVSGISDLNTTFTQMSAAFQSNQALQASTMVGRNVLIESNVATLNDSGELKASVDLGQAATNVIMTVNDASGQIVSRQELGYQPSGLMDFKWDGHDQNGSPLEAGRFTVSAEIHRGSSITAGVTLTSVQVESVTLGQGGSDLTLTVSELGDISMADIRKIM